MLSTTSEHALRALARIASISSQSSSRNGNSVLGSALSVEARVPFHYLSKILRSLTKAGILKASRGRGGGYRLAKPADQVSLIDVIELFDGVKAKPDCLLGGGWKCSDEKPCSAHESFKRVRRAYVEFLETTSIADIAGASPRDGVRR